MNKSNDELKKELALLKKQKEDVEENKKLQKELNELKKKDNKIVNGFLKFGKISAKIGKNINKNMEKKFNSK